MLGLPDHPQAEQKWLSSSLEADSLNSALFRQKKPSKTRLKENNTKQGSLRKGDYINFDISWSSLFSTEKFPYKISLIYSLSYHII